MTVDITLKNEVDNSYKIIIDSLENIVLNTKVAIVTNPKVAGFHLAYLLEKIQAPEVYIITVPDGESYKNMQSLNNILENLFDHRFNRNSMLIAFGGGVIGDMTGFAASIYQRGIDFIQIPTTLLSQVDASVGGKTGINNRFGKNLIGAFHQPQAVYIDPYFLTTLPEREFAAGVAEIVKMAVTFDQDFFEWLEKNDLHDQELMKIAIEKAVKTKAWVVAQDEKERGLRAALNYGHTFGHVIENETKYTKYLHGESVAIGMVMANDVACELDLMNQSEADRIKELLERYNLPTSYNIKDVNLFYETFFLDKKSSDSAIMFIIPHHLGGVVMRNDIDAQLIKNILKTYQDS
ncbi:MAG: 3-dehydroquinate synthase [Campylobacterota bacterium]|nr:3-dehydroquinate synthase [Campylobacterota bacterium]